MSFTEIPAMFHGPHGPPTPQKMGQWSHLLIFLSHLPIKKCFLNMSIIICETNRQSRFDAGDRVLGAGALGDPE